MGVRRQAREAALQALFMCDFLSEWNQDSVSFCLDHFAASSNARPFTERLCDGVIANKTKIDAELTCASENWSLSRMGRVDRAILRVATYEIVFLDDIPVNVAINEAIEIAKRFGAEESPQFVNGVLDKVASTVRKPKAATKVANTLAVEVLNVKDSDESNPLDMTLPIAAIVESEEDSETVAEESDTAA